MADIPIIFSAPMVRALLDGRKTMTRRILFPHRTLVPLSVGENEIARRRILGWRVEATDDPAILHGWPRSSWHKATPGDRLWVREGIRWSAANDNFYYIADDRGVGNDNYHWLRANGGEKSRPSIHMPRRVSRLSLVVTETKVERLQDISEEDARAEGVPHQHNVKWLGGDPGTIHDVCRRNFYALWCQLHSYESWAQNPEVVCISFTVHQQNIDAMKVAA